MRYLAFALLPILVVAAPPSAALAAYTFTIQVPVKVNNLPPGATVSVECMLYKNANGTGLMDGVVPGRSTANSGTYSVQMHTPNTQPGSYQCWVLVVEGGIINFTGGDPANASMVGKTLSPAPGWTGTMSIIGKLP
jgi:hypothetical protein